MRSRASLCRNLRLAHRWQLGEVQDAVHESSPRDWVDWGGWS